MALSIQEQLQLSAIQSRADTEFSIRDIIFQISVGRAKDFLENKKTFDEATNGEAATYVRKTVGFVSRIFRNDLQSLKLLQSVLFSILGDTTFTFTQVNEATTQQWVTFFQNNIVEAFEICALVQKEEKDAYVALP